MGEEVAVVDVVVEEVEDLMCPGTQVMNLMRDPLSCSPYVLVLSILLSSPGARTVTRGVTHR